MLLRLIAIFVFALAVGGAVYLINRYVFNGQLPKWVLPTSIAASIIGFHVFEEYNWYPHIQSQMDENYATLQIREPRQFWRPWSMVHPSVTGVTVLDKAEMKTLTDHPEISVGWMTSLSRFGGSSDAIFAFDCTQNRFGPYTEDVSQIEWAPMSDEIVREICDGWE